VGCSSCIFELRDVVISKASKGSSIIQSHTFDKEKIEHISGLETWTIQKKATGAVTAFGKNLDPEEVDMLEGRRVMSTVVVYQALLH